MIYPWHQSEWDQFIRNLGNTHHGILLIGQKGIGKAEFGLSLSQLLLCSHTDAGEAPCQECHNCRLYSAGTHPDFHVITTEYDSVNGHLPLIAAYGDRYLDRAEIDSKTKYSRVISVDRIRELTERFSTHSHISSSRVALIYPADRMNNNAANALLKLLEEPPLNAKFILVTAEPNRLPATIRSRCVNHTLHTPDSDSATRWLNQFNGSQDIQAALELANGAPVLARELIENGDLNIQQSFLEGLVSVLENQKSPVNLAPQFIKIELEQLLLWTQQFVADLVMWRECGRPPFWEKACQFDRYAIRIDRLYGLYDRICHYRRIARDSVNAQLVIEDLLISLQRTVVRNG